MHEKRSARIAVRCVPCGSFGLVGIVRQRADR
jgi:hypothetical protein